MYRSLSTSLALAVMILVGCASSAPKTDQNKEIYTYRTSQSAPQPVYYRFRKSRSPEPLPVEEPFVGDESLFDVVSIRGGKTKLATLARRVAGDIGYDLFISSLVIDRIRIMPTTSGKIDIVLSKIASVYDVKVVLDHNSRKVSILRNR